MPEMYWWKCGIASSPRKNVFRRLRRLRVVHFDRVSGQGFLSWVVGPDKRAIGRSRQNLSRRLAGLASRMSHKGGEKFRSENRGRGHGPKLGEDGSVTADQ